jgi:hypothetical protein
MAKNKKKEYYMLIQRYCEPNFLTAGEMDELIAI